MTSYKLIFKKQALQEWLKLDSTIKEQFKKKLKQRLVNPRVDSSRHSRMEDCYKIKLRSSDYRLVYQARDNELVISIVAVGKREKHKVYKLVLKRL